MLVQNSVSKVRECMSHQCYLCHLCISVRGEGFLFFDRDQYHQPRPLERILLHCCGIDCFPTCILPSSDYRQLRLDGSYAGFCRAPLIGQRGAHFRGLDRSRLNLVSYAWRWAQGALKLPTRSCYLGHTRLIMTCKLLVFNAFSWMYS